MPIDSEASICNLALGRVGINKAIDTLDDASERAQACKIYYAQCRDQLLESFPWPFATRRAALTVYAGAAWDSAHSYAKGDIAGLGASVYRSLVAANLNNEPDLSPAQWFQLTRDGWTYAAPLPDDYLAGQAIYESPTQAQTANAIPFALLQDLRLPTDVPPWRVTRSDQREPFAIEDANDGTNGKVLLCDLDTPVLKYTAQISATVSFPPWFISALAWLLASELAGSLRSDEKKQLAARQAYTMALSEAIAGQLRAQQTDREPVSEIQAARE